MANTPRPEPSPTAGARGGIAAPSPPVHAASTPTPDPGAIIVAPNGLAPSARENADGVPAPPARNCPPQRDLWPDVCHVGPTPPLVAPTPAKPAEPPTAAKSEAPSPVPAGTPEVAAPSPTPAPTTDWQGVLEPSPTPSAAIATPTPAPTAAATDASLYPAFFGLGLALIFAIGLVAALLYLRRATGRIAEVEAGIAEALGRPDATIEDGLAFILSHEPVFDDAEESPDDESPNPDKAPPEPARDDAAVPDDPPVDASRLAVQASYCLEATAAHAADLMDDPEFAIFARRLNLIEGSRVAARSLLELGGVDAAAYRQGMYERLQAGVFDGALTSLDVLGAYAHPDGEDWRAFLVHFEAAEALLTLALADCEIDVFRRPLLEPVERATLTDATFGSDARGLGSIPSAVRRARTRLSKLGDDDRDIVFDCYSPGWRSAVFGSRGAFIAFFDPSSMTGAPP